MSSADLLPGWEIRRRLAPFFLAGVMAILFVNTLGDFHYEIGALQVRMSASIFTVPQGKTRLALPPIGEVEAATHKPPVLLQVALQSIDLALIQQMSFPAGDPDVVLERFIGQAQGALSLFLIKLSLLAMLGGGLGVWIAGGRHPQHLWQGAFIGLAIILLFAGLVWLDYSPQAFNSPEYTGMLEAAPWMTGLLQESLQRVEELGEQLQLLSSNLYSLYQRVQELQPLGIMDADLKVLHVSDIHNNPVAFDLIQQVTASFGIDLIIDTGDLTDWGTPLELEIVNRIEEMNIPYFFVPGNHETPEAMARLRQTDNVIVLDGQMVEKQGLRIWGIADEAAFEQLARTAPVERLQQLTRIIDNQVNQLQPQPHIVAVHNNRIATGLTVDVPVILYGHNHRLEVTTRQRTMLINAGTTGASGIRGLQSKNPIPFSLAILYFSKGEQLQLKAVDTLKVATLPGGFTLERFAPPHISPDEVDYLINQGE